MTMLPSSSKRTGLLALILIAGLGLLIGWYGLIFSQSLKQAAYLRTVDFSIFYTAGRIARQGGWSDVYDLQRQLEVQGGLVGRSLTLDELLPFNHPPVLLPWLAVIAVDDYIQAYHTWMSVQILILLVMGFWIFRMVRKLEWDRLSSWLFTIVCVLFYPIFTGLLKGQDTSLALLGLAVCLSGLIGKNDREAGLGLSLLVIRPQLALCLGLPFIFKRRKIWWWFLGAASLLGVFSVLLVGWKGVQDFLHLLAISASGEQVVIHQFDMVNLKGMLIRLFPALNMDVVYAISWGAYLMAILLLCFWWARSADIGPRHLGLAVILALFVSPHLHDHDLALLLIPVAALCIELVRQNLLSPLASSVLVLGISIYMAVVQLTSVKFLGIYLLMLLTAVALGYLGRRTPTLQPTRETT
jgi:hypothetical protein